MSDTTTEYVLNRDVYSDEYLAAHDESEQTWAAYQVARDAAEDAWQAWRAACAVLHAVPTERILR